MITPTLYRTNPPVDISCTKCLRPLVDDVLAHDENCLMHEECWREAAEEAPDRLIEDGTVACPKCHTLINAETLFPWSRIAVHMLRAGAVGVGNGVEAALKGTLGIAAANAVRKITIVRSQTIGDFRSLLALSFAAFCAKARLIEHADNPAPSIPKALMAGLVVFIVLRAIFSVAAPNEAMTDISTTAIGIIGNAVLNMFCSAEGRLAPVWEAMQLAILCLASAIGRTIEFPRETSALQTTIMDAANIIPLALFGLAFLDLCTSTRTKAAAAAGFALGWLWQWSQFSLTPPVPVLD